MASPLGGDDVLIATHPYSGLPRSPHLQVSSAGTLFIALEVPTVAFPFWGVEVHRSTDGGDTWTLWSTFSPGDFQNFGDFLIAEGVVDRAFIAYQSNSSPATVRMAYADLAAGVPTWTVYTAASSPGVGFSPEMDFDTDAWGFSDYYLHLVVQAQDGNGLDIWYARSTNQGTSFAAADRIASISDGSFGYILPRVSSGDGAYVHVAYLRFGAVDNGLYYRRSPNYGGGPWDVQQTFDALDNGVQAELYALAASPSDGNVLLSAPSGWSGSVRGLSTDFGATWTFVDSSVLYTVRDGIAFLPGGIVEGSAQSASDDGGFAISRSVVGDPATMAPAEEMASHADDGIFNVGGIVVDPTRGNRVAAVWEYIVGSNTLVRFDAEWRRDPGYPNTDIGFPIPIAGGGQTPPAVADVDGDPELEIVFGTRSGDVHVVNHDGSNVPGWPVNIGGMPFDAPVAVGHLTGNREAFVVAGNTSGEVYAFDPSGDVRPGWPVDLGTGTDVFVSIGALGPPYPHYVVALSWKTVAILNYAGVNVAPAWVPPQIPYGTFARPAAIGDIDTDGLTDIVSVAGTNVYFHQLGVPGYTSTTLDGEIFSDAPTLADIEDDGDLEIAVPTISGKMYLVGLGEPPIPGWPITVSPGVPLTSAAMAHIVGPPEVDLAFAERNGLVHVRHFDAVEQTGYPQATTGIIYMPPMLYPVNEYVTNVNIGTVGSIGHSWRNIAGIAVPGWPRNLHGPVEETFAAGDIDNDGRNEIVVLGVNYLTVFDVGTAPPTDPRTYWPMYAHDAQRTGCLDCEETVSAVDDASPSPHASALAVYPNPFNPGTTIAYDVTDAGPVTLAVYDVAGRVVEVLIDGDHHEPNRYTMRYDHNLSSGVYFVRLVTGGNEIATKMVVLK